MDNRNNDKKPEIDSALETESRVVDPNADKDTKIAPADKDKNADKDTKKNEKPADKDKKDSEKKSNSVDDFEPLLLDEEDDDDEIYNQLLSIVSSDGVSDDAKEIKEIAKEVEIHIKKELRDKLTNEEKLKKEDVDRVIKENEKRIKKVSKISATEVYLLAKAKKSPAEYNKADLVKQASAKGDKLVEKIIKNQKEKKANPTSRAELWPKSEERANQEREQKREQEQKKEQKQEVDAEEKKTPSFGKK